MTNSVVLHILEKLENLLIFLPTQRIKLELFLPTLMRTNDENDKNDKNVVS